MVSNQALLNITLSSNIEEAPMIKRQFPPLLAYILTCTMTPRDAQGQWQQTAID
jgi:hypothetical protein